jgi:hypothetical protein
MKTRNPRIICADGVSLSVQANEYAYCSPRINGLDKWSHYIKVEVGFITDSNNIPFTPPDSWRVYSDGSFPSDVYGYIPKEMVEDFIKSHGGAVSPTDEK